MAPLKSANGLIRVRFIKSYLSYNKGQEAGFEATEAERMRDSGIVEILQKAPPPERVGKRVVPESTIAPGTGNAPATVVTVPDDWREMHHTRQMALARELGADVSTKADAIAAIELELERRAGDPNPADDGEDQ